MADNTAFSLLKQRSFGTSASVFQDHDHRAITPSGSNNARSLYIHIPFCSHKCHYCDFYSIVDRQDRQQLFIDRLVRELGAMAPYANQAPLKSIFIGGGTPSLLAPKLWTKLLSTLDQLFDLSAIRDGSGEFSIENNPESVSQELADTYAQGGVNRISMGAQSFNPKHLESLDRIHDPEKVPVAIEHFLAAGIKRISLDLIYAIPNQTVEDWDTDLRTALAMPIEHLSAYGLTYEPGTKMTALLARGKFNKMPDETEVQLYQHGLKTLREHGFERYEVSNHAKPGAECRHNLSYWRSENWLVAGPSASGHFNGTRWKNTPRLDDYLKIDEDGFAPICDLEPPDSRRELMDILMTSVRLSEGVDAAHAIEQAGKFNAKDELLGAIKLCQENGWLDTDTESRWTLTDDGFLYADWVARELIGALIEE